MEVNGNPTWNANIPLGEDGHLPLTRCFGQAQVPSVLAPFVGALHRNICVNNGAKYSTAAGVDNAGGAERRCIAVGA